MNDGIRSLLVGMGFSGALLCGCVHASYSSVSMHSSSSARSVSSLSQNSLGMYVITQDKRNAKSAAPSVAINMQSINRSADERGYCSFAFKGTQSPHKPQVYRLEEAIRTYLENLFSFSNSKGVGTQESPCVYEFEQECGLEYAATVVAATYLDSSSPGLARIHEETFAGVQEILGLEQSKFSAQAVCEYIVFCFLYEQAQSDEIHQECEPFREKVSGWLMRAYLERFRGTRFSQKTLSDLDIELEKLGEEYAGRRKVNPRTTLAYVQAFKQTIFNSLKEAANSHQSTDRIVSDSVALALSCELAASCSTNRNTIAYKVEQRRDSVKAAQSYAQSTPRESRGMGHTRERSLQTGGPVLLGSNNVSYQNDEELNKLYPLQPIEEVVDIQQYSCLRRCFMRYPKISILVSVCILGGVGFLSYWAYTTLGKAHRRELTRVWGLWGC